MMCLSVLKPLSIQLQKHNDIYNPNTQVSSVKSDLKAIREQLDVHFNQWYEASVELGKGVTVKFAVPKIAIRQQHRDNVPDAKPAQYLQHSLRIPRIDHLVAQMDTYFSEIHMNISKLGVWYLKNWSAQVTPQLIQQFSFNEMITCHQMSLTLSLSIGIANGQTWLTNRVLQIVPQPPIFFPKIKVLLRILCTLPVTSTECKSSFSTLKSLKMYLTSTMQRDSQVWR